MRCVVASCLVVMPGCLLLIDRPTGAEEEAVPMTAEDSSEGGESEPACVDQTAEGTGVLSGTTLGAANDIEGCGIGGDAVISWIAPSTDVYTFSVLADFDSMIGISRASCGAAPMECVDDCYGTDAALEYAADRGEELFIVIDSYTGARGDFTLAIDRGSVLYCDDGSSSSSGTSGGYGSTSWYPTTG